MPFVWKNNTTIETKESSISSMYSSRPLAIYRKELIQDNNIIKKDKEESKEECFNTMNNARKRLRSGNNKDNLSFQSSKQYLQNRNELYDQNIFSTKKSTELKDINITPTIKWSNSQFLQNGATSSSSYISKKHESGNINHR